MAATVWTQKEINHMDAEIIKKMRLKCPDDEDTRQAYVEEPIISNAIDVLGDFCRSEYHPFPRFDYAGQKGRLHAPEFRMKCTVGKIEQYGSASTKKGARRLAAQKMLKILQEEPTASTSRETASVHQTDKEREELNLEKIKKDRNWKNSIAKSAMDIHWQNFFKNLANDKRINAYTILYDESITSSKHNFDLLLKILQIPYKVQEVPAMRGPLCLIELYCDCDQNLEFGGSPVFIYDDIIRYLQYMLR